jgi:hypothetical protein
MVRIRARLPLKLPIWICYRESFRNEWTEKSRLVDVSQFGAGFTLTRPVDIGRLLRVQAPLPYQLRCFDHFERLYSVWAVVRHISVIAQQPASFRVGVAFLGKHAPPSYAEDPTRRYTPLPIKPGQTSLWKVTRLPLTQQRREPRLNIPMEVLVEALDEHGLPFMREYTVTETISRLGTCVPSSLDIGLGRMLRITSVTDQISIFAAVRSREIKSDGVARLGLEFVGDHWPLDRDLRSL